MLPARARFFYFLFLLFLVLVLAVPAAVAQTSSGEISGRVVDSSGAVVVGAQVVLTNQATGEQRALTTDAAGNFRFVALQPGDFSIAVTAANFKRYDKRDLHLSASQRLSAGELPLQVGAHTETVSVTAEAATVQTESAERSALLDQKELSTLMTVGRDPMSLLRVLPGIVDAGDSNLRDTDSTGGDQLGTSGPGVINGVRGSSNAVSIDGVNGNPRGDGNKLDTALNMDAVSEVKVVLTGYQAEYGQSAGGIVNLVTKSGTRDFHGSAYYYGRNEALNANDFFRNYTNQPRSLYRYNVYGFTIGGPAYIPKVFNTKKDKLFFFFSTERWPVKTPINDQYFMMPSPAELNGDFSSTYDTKGQKVYIRDPLKSGTCSASSQAGCFTDASRATASNPTGLNIIPLARINPNTQRLMGIFDPTKLPGTFINCTPFGQGGAAKCPLTNVTTGNPYNYFINGTRETPSNQEVLRVDYQINSKWHMFFRGQIETHDSTGLNATTNATPWGIPGFYNTPSKHGGINLTYVASPTLVNEFNFGYASWNEFTGVANAADAKKLDKAALGIALGQNNPAQNPLDLIPRITGLSSGGSNGTFQLAQAPQVSFDNRFPMNDRTGTWEGTENLTKVWNEHTFKAGVYMQTGRYLQSHTGSTFDGNFNFGVNTSSPFDTQYAYANMLLGSYSSYQEGSNNANYDPHWKILEWYLQDHWKLAPNLSVDYGVRFTYDLPTVLAPGQGAGFVFGRYDPSKVPALYVPVLYKNLSSSAQSACKGNSRTTPTICAQNPSNLADVKSSAFNGTFVSSFGYTGVVVNTDPSYPRSLRNSNGLLYAPRLGLAWDPFKDGKTAVRLGSGLYYNTREGGGTVGDYFSTPPVIVNSSVGYGQIVNGQNFTANCGATHTCYDPSSQVNEGPLATRILQPNRKIESTLGVNLGIQRIIGYDTVADVAYVGTFGRHLNQQIDLNEVPYLAQNNPAYIDKSQTTAILSGTPLNGTFSGSVNTFFYGPHHDGVVVQQAKLLSDNYFRPYPGYAAINLRDYGGTSNYNSLQTSLNRRFTKGLQFGIAYTFSKAMATQAVVNGGVATYQDRRFWNYGLANFDHTHDFVAHWVWTMPKATRLWDNKIVGAIANNWEWSGIAEFISGAPYSVAMSGNPNLTGGGDGANPLVFGNVYAPKDQIHSTLHYINTAAFVLPPIGVIPSPDQPGMTRNIVFRGPGSDNWNMALQKNIPLYKERVMFTLRAEAYNIFNHPSFTLGRVDQSLTADFDTASSCTGAAANDPKCGSGLVKSASTFGQVTGERFGPRVMQISGRITF